MKLPAWPNQDPHTRKIGGRGGREKNRKKITKKKSFFYHFESQVKHFARLLCGASGYGGKISFRFDFNPNDVDQSSVTRRGGKGVELIITHNFNEGERERERGWEKESGEEYGLKNPPLWQQQKEGGKQKNQLWNWMKKKRFEEIEKEKMKSREEWEGNEMNGRKSELLLMLFHGNSTARVFFYSSTKSSNSTALQKTPTRRCRILQVTPSTWRWFNRSIIQKKN